MATPQYTINTDLHYENFKQKKMEELSKKKNTTPFLHWLYKYNKKNDTLLNYVISRFYIDCTDSLEKAFEAGVEYQKSQEVHNGI